MSKNTCYIGAPKAPLLERALRRPFAFLGAAMRRIAVFVDAGYFWVQAVHIIWGKKASRDEVIICYPTLRERLLEQVRTQFPNAELLRVYWYDGPGPSGKTICHRSIEDMDDFKLRLGTRNGVGAQKAVDGLIIADMISLAQTKAISEALLVTGDADLTPGVMAAQNLGIRVHLLSMGPTEATSPYLKAEVDRKTHWDDIEVRKFVTAASAKSVTAPALDLNPAPSPVIVVAPTQPEAALSVNPRDFAVIAQTVFATLARELQAQIPKEGALPQEVDRRLLSKGRKELGRALDEQEKRNLRDALRASAHP